MQEGLGWGVQKVHGQFEEIGPGVPPVPQGILKFFLALTAKD